MNTGETIALIKAFGNGGGGGGGSNKFIVTLTPTALDYSGTMDKTPKEISAAYEDGMEIVFRVVGVPNYDYVDVKATEAILYPNHIWQMSAYLIMLPDMLIYFYNGFGEATYSTTVYSLTPAS